MEKLDPMASGSAFTCFCDNFRPEVANGVISGVAVGDVGVDVSVKFGDTGSNYSRDIRAP